MSQPKLRHVYSRTTRRPYAVEFHLVGCSCPDCLRTRHPVPPALPITRLTFAGIIVGNAIAFAIDPAGAAHALLATIGL